MDAEISILMTCVWCKDCSIIFVNYIWGSVHPFLLLILFLCVHPSWWDTTLWKQQLLLLLFAGMSIIKIWYFLHMCTTLDCSSFVFSMWCHGFQGVQAFLQQCKGSDEIFLLPNQQLLVPPGGQLVHSLNLHTADVTGLAMTADGKFVVTCKLKQQCWLTAEKSFALTSLVCEDTGLTFFLKESLLSLVFWTWLFEVKVPCLVYLVLLWLF